MMQPIGGKKAIAICILRILEDYSDFDHPLTHADIIRILQNEYGIEAARNAVGRNISLLCEMGYDISTYEENGKGTYLRERLFDNMELLVLIDSVLSSSYIPADDAKRLIEKLGGLSNRYFHKKLPHVNRLLAWNHQRNKEFFWNLELLSEAIEVRKQVAFTYNRAKEDGELHPLRTTKDRVHPFSLVCTAGQYYLIASYHSYDNLRHYRVDRMTDIEMLDSPARNVTEITDCVQGLDVARYAAEHNFMFGGKAERIVLKMPIYSASDVLDVFGHSAKMAKMDDEYMKVTVFAAIGGMRYFVLQFGTVCEVLEPQELRKAVIEDVRDIGRRYGINGIVE